MTRLTLCAVAAAVTALLSSRCPAQSGEPPPLDLLKTVPASSVGEVPDEEDCWDFALAFEEALYGLDPKALAGLIDWRAIAEAATRGIEAEREVEQGFTTGIVSKGRLGDNGLPLTLVNAIEEGGSLTPLRVIPGDANPVVRSRLITADGSLTYIDFSLARRDDGSIKAVDIIPHTVGEPVSQTIRRFYLSVVAESERGELDRLAGDERSILAQISALDRMNADLLAKRFEDVLTTYRSLPEELQRERIYLLLRFTAASEVDEDEYAAATGDLLRLYPDDSNANLLMIDHYFLQGKIDEAIAAIDRVDEAIGGDPYLLVLRAGMRIAQEDFDRARADLEHALERDPLLIETYWSLINLSLVEEDYDATVRSLDLLAANFEVEFNDLTKLPEYAGFVQTPQFAEWRARQPEPPAPDIPDPIDEPAPAVEVPPDF